MGKVYTDPQREREFAPYQKFTMSLGMLLSLAGISHGKKMKE